LCGSGSRKIAATTAEICKTRRKILCSPEGKFYMVKLHFSSKNKEENPLLLQRQSHFAPQNKEDWDEEVRDYYQT
jgi:hypothetical protein